MTKMTTDMEIKQEQILQAIPDVNTSRLDEFVASFNMWSVHFGIVSKRRVIHYIAQVMAETGALNYMVENLNYSKEGLLEIFPKYFNRENVGIYARNPEKIGNRVYANRMGNSSEGSGDGYRYRGRGYIQLTGKSNYIAFNKSDCCTEDVVKNPDRVSSYYLNQVSALWYWSKNGINAIADLDDGSNGMSVVEKVTRKVNGGANGLSQRRRYYKQLKEVFGL